MLLSKQTFWKILLKTVQNSFYKNTQSTIRLARTIWQKRPKNHQNLNSTVQVTISTSSRVTFSVQLVEKVIKNVWKKTTDLPHSGRLMINSLTFLNFLRSVKKIDPFRKTYQTSEAKTFFQSITQWTKTTENIRFTELFITKFETATLSENKSRLWNANLQLFVNRVRLSLNHEFLLRNNLLD